MLVKESNTGGNSLGFLRNKLQQNSVYLPQQFIDTNQTKL